MQVGVEERRAETKQGLSSKTRFYSRFQKNVLASRHGEIRTVFPKYLE